MPCQFTVIYSVSQLCQATDSVGRAPFGTEVSAIAKATTDALEIHAKRRTKGSFGAHS